MHDPRFERTRLLLGEAALARLAAARVTVVGLGAVGSYAVEGLARGGVGHLRLVDFDRVEISNINRQLYALESTLGRPKAELAAARVKDINPACAVEALALFVNRETVAAVLEPRPDLVIDAIDSLNAKVTLLAACVEAGVPAIASMGAARRTDPAQIRVADIGETFGCPLARFVRKRLHRRGIRSGIRCVFSGEAADDATVECGVRSAECGEGEPEPRTLNPEPFPGGRRRRAMGSSSCLTGIMGLMAAQEAIRLLTATRDDAA